MTREKLLENAKPILFNTEMVKAILDGRKSCTRRVIKYDKRGEWIAVNNCRDHPFGATVPCYLWRENSVDDTSANVVYPKFDVGDILWVRETWGDGYDKGTYIYKADDKLADLEAFKTSTKILYRPSIHMPKEATRIFLRVTDVRAERLQDITIDGIEHEGIPLTYPIVYLINSEHLKRFVDLWDSTVKKQELDIYGFDANPFVWVIEFAMVIGDDRR